MSEPDTSDRASQHPVHLKRNRWLAVLLRVCIHAAMMGVICLVMRAIYAGPLWVFSGFAQLSIGWWGSFALDVAALILACLSGQIVSRNWAFLVGAVFSYFVLSKQVYCSVSKVIELPSCVYRAEVTAILAQNYSGMLMSAVFVSVLSVAFVLTRPNPNPTARGPRD